jgi:hypothetical protein
MILNSLIAIKADFQMFGLLAKLEDGLAMKSIFINEPRELFKERFEALKSTLKQFSDQCNRSLDAELSTRFSDCVKLKALLEYIDILSALTADEFNLNFKQIIGSKIDATFVEVNQVIESLALVTSEQQFQSYFDGLFEKINLHFKFLNEIEVNFVGDFSADLRNKKSKCLSQLVESINLLFISIETNIESLINGFDDVGNDSGETSVQFFNAYNTIAAFKLKMKDTYEKHFSARAGFNIDNILWQKIMAKFECLEKCIQDESKNFKKVILLNLF